MCAPLLFLRAVSVLLLRVVFIEPLCNQVADPGTNHAGHHGARALVHQSGKAEQPHQNLAYRLADHYKMERPAGQSENRIRDGRILPGFGFLDRKPVLRGFLSRKLTLCGHGG